MALFGFFKGGSANDKKSFHVDKGKVFRYTHMPEILPRIRALGQKFGQFAYLLALIYRSARLLPANHPMLNPANIGKFGVGDVMATAANGLVMKRDNLDQILIFGAVALAMIMIVIQAALIAVYAFMGSAHAAAGDGSMFTTPNPGTDVITKFLNQVFGFQNIFAAGGADVVQTQPGFYAILGFYSTAMMIIAVMIVIYYVITVVGESAQSGQPFGRRFNGLWAPVRLVLALGLLVPLGGGINAAQFMTLYIAKFGSGLATQGWITFVEKFADPKPLLANVSAPSAQGLAGAIFANEVCRAAYNQVHKNSGSIVSIKAFNGTSLQNASFSGSDLTWAMGAGVGKITYIWMVDKPGPGARKGMPFPVCGAIEMQLIPKGQGSKASIANSILSGMQNAYVTAMGQIVTDVSGQIGAVQVGSITDKIARKAIATNGGNHLQESKVLDEELSDKLAQAINAAQDSVNSAVAGITWDSSSDNVLDRMTRDAKERGWGTAGVYYLEIAKITQLILDSVGRSYPVSIAQPDGTVTVASQSFMKWAGEKLGITESDKQVRMAIARIPDIFSAAIVKSTALPKNSKGVVSPNEKFLNRGGSIWDPMYTVATWMFGDAFATMIDTPELNPMGRLIQGGTYILDKTRYLVYTYIAAQAGVIGGSILGAIAGTAVSGAVTGGTAIPAGAMFGMAAGAFISTVLGALGGLIWFFLLIGLAVGIVLFYMLPLLPFMYFFFSAVNWVIEVAEAFVSMPLFALSHLRIEGDGLPGQAAMQGWLILFGVLLRPLMIVVGMIMGSLIFNAGAYYLNQVYKYAIFAYNPDVGGGGAAGLDFSQISGFGIITYLVLYVYLIYMLANSSFKLIDTVPDKMMRWIGGPTPFTGDRPVELGSMQNMALAGYAVASQAQGAVKGISDTLGSKNAERAAGAKKHNAEVNMRDRAPGGGGAGAGGA